MTADGFILTKGSEVMGKGKIWVALKTGTQIKDYEAKVVGWSEPLDLAMLKIESTGLTPVTFADTRPPPEPVEATPAAGAGGQGARAGGGRSWFGWRWRAWGRRARAGGRTGPVVMPTVTTMPTPPEGAVH